MLIRKAVIEDAKSINAIYDEYVKHTAITFEYETPSTKEMERRIATISSRYPFLVAEDKGQIIGYAYASALSPRAAYQWSVETSIYVDDKKKRQGIGRKLYAALEEALKAQGIINLYACIAYGEDEHLNKDSIVFHESLGYVTVGHFHQCGYKFDRWYDVVWMEKKL